jgi:hypothetical protein
MPRSQTWYIRIASYARASNSKTPPSKYDKEQTREAEDLDSLALGFGDGSPLAALDGPWEVRDGNDEKGVAAQTHVRNFFHFI